MNTFKNSGQYGAYGFSLDQGLQALDRTHAAAGNLSSGNADTDAMKYATGLAGQTYGNYLVWLCRHILGQTAALYPERPGRKRAKELLLITRIRPKAVLAIRRRSVSVTRMLPLIWQISRPIRTSGMASWVSASLQRASSDG
jgi:hypothetical protein